MIKTAKSQPHLIFRRFSSLVFFISDSIFSAVHAALSLHIQKKKEESAHHVVYEGEKSPRNKATIKELVRIHLKSIPHTMCALGVLTSLKLASWANI